MTKTQRLKTDTNTTSNSRVFGRDELSRVREHANVKGRGPRDPAKRFAEKNVSRVPVSEYAHLLRFAKQHATEATSSKKATAATPVIDNSKYAKVDDSIVDDL